jgi:arylformamidase
MDKAIMTKILLSHPLSKNTPTYGNRNRVVLAKISDIKAGDIANDTFISMSVHCGTHIDMPRHFFADGQTWSDFPLEYWNFINPLFIEIDSDNLIIKDELITMLEKVYYKDSVDILIVKTGACHKRTELKTVMNNYGFHPDTASYIRKRFPNVRAFGFDSLSVSSYTDRMTGRKAHKQFLNPDKPILLVEDMNLTEISTGNTLKRVDIAPLFIDQSDAVPCTVFAEI